MTFYILGQILTFDPIDGHPDSKIVGVDHYSFQANDKKTREWKSYTLVPVNQADIQGLYERWYVVDFPDIGMSFVEVVQESDFPDNLEQNIKLTGQATIVSDGDAEMGTGQAILETFNAGGEGVMFARETFQADKSVMYFKNSPLRGPVGVQ